MDEQTVTSSSANHSCPPIPSAELARDKSLRRQSSLEVRAIESPSSNRPLHCLSIARENSSYQARLDQNLAVNLESRSKQYEPHVEFEVLATSCTPRTHSDLFTKSEHEVLEAQSSRTQDPRSPNRLPHVLWQHIQSNPLNICLSILFPFVPGKRNSSSRNEQSSILS